MSEREQIQDRLEQFLINNGLNDVYGVLTDLVTLKDGRKIRQVTFCKARTLDGTVSIYSPSFFTVRTNRTRTEAFRSVDEVEQYILENFC